MEQHKTAENLCDGECFADHFRFQKGTMLGTAFLVRSNLILTAKHVLSLTGDKKLCLVFGHSSDGARANVERIPATNVYGLGSVLSQSDVSGDWAFVALTTATSRPALLLRSKAVATNESVFKIGHPFGLPAIVSGNATVNGFIDAFFYASLDASNGDSGAPVFDLNGSVVGVFRGGGRDLFLKYPPGCYWQKPVTNPMHPGQKVTPVATLSLP